MFWLVEWRAPEPLDTLINTSAGEYYPSVAASSNLYFTATREDGVGKEDIYMSRLIDGTYQAPEVLDTNINSTTYEFNAYITPDENTLFFGSYGRMDDLGGGDIYLSYRQSDGSWGKAIRLSAPINSSKLDYCPFIDTCRGIFYFTSERSTNRSKSFDSVKTFIDWSNSPGNGLGDIYHCRIDAILTYSH